MRQHASLHSHDSIGGAPPTIIVQHRPAPRRRHRLAAAAVGAAAAGSLGGLSAAGASTPLPATPAARPAAAHRAVPVARRPVAPVTHVPVLLRRPAAGLPTAPGSWARAALHLALARLTEQAPRTRHLAAAPRAHLHLASSTVVSDGVSPSTWLALRECESSDDYSIDTGNGYYGAYQFSAQTWWSIGYSGLPSQAPPAVQDAAAARLLALQGWSAWPVCSGRIGM
jgi:hypothetical protein